MLANFVSRSASKLPYLYNNPLIWNASCNVEDFQSIEGKAPRSRGAHIKKK